MKYFIFILIGFNVLHADLSRNSHGIVTDSITKLQWQDNISASNASWKEAIGYCKTLELDGKGWRLPQVQELRSIIDNNWREGVPNNSFKYTNTFAYWSSTPVTKYSGTTWGIYLYYGVSYWDSKNSYCNIKCVRDNE